MSFPGFTVRAMLSTISMPPSVISFTVTEPLTSDTSNQHPQISSTDYGLQASPSLEHIVNPFYGTSLFSGVLQHDPVFTDEDMTDFTEPPTSTSSSAMNSNPSQSAQPDSSLKLPELLTSLTHTAVQIEHEEARFVIRDWTRNRISTLSQAPSKLELVRSQLQGSEGAGLTEEERKRKLQTKQQAIEAELHLPNKGEAISLWAKHGNIPFINWFPRSFEQNDKLEKCLSSINIDSEDGKATNEKDPLIKLLFSRGAFQLASSDIMKVVGL